MKWSDLTELVAGSVVAWPLAARAEPSPVCPLIGLPSPLAAKATGRNVAAFRSALRDLGYAEGRKITVALRYGDRAAERMPAGRSFAVTPTSELRLGITQRGLFRPLWLRLTSSWCNKVMRSAKEPWLFKPDLFVRGL